MLGEDQLLGASVGAVLVGTMVALAWWMDRFAGEMSPGKHPCSLEEELKQLGRIRATKTASSGLCLECGGEFPEGARFCPRCGGEL